MFTALKNTIAVSPFSSMSTTNAADRLIFRLGGYQLILRATIIKLFVLRIRSCHVDQTRFPLLCVMEGTMSRVIRATRTSRILRRLYGRLILTLKLGHMYINLSNHKAIKIFSTASSQSNMRHFLFRVFRMLRQIRVYSVRPG